MPPRKTRQPQPDDDSARAKRPKEEEEPSSVVSATSVSSAGRFADDVLITGSSKHKKGAVAALCVSLQAPFLDAKEAALKQGLERLDRDLVDVVVFVTDADKIGTAEQLKKA